MQREEANERRRLGELQAKLDGMKIKDVALKANKPSKPSTSNKNKGSKQPATSKPKKSSKCKNLKVQHHPQVKMKVMVPITRRSRTLLSL
jgi:hypothetical protein